MEKMEVFDSNNHLYVSTLPTTLDTSNLCGKLIKYDGSVWTHYKSTNSQFPNDAITNLCFDKDNNLWIGTNISGLIKFDCNNSWTFYNSQNSGLPYNQIGNLEIDNNNNKWMSVFSNGLSVFNENGIIPTSITKKK